MIFRKNLFFGICFVSLMLIIPVSCKVAESYKTPEISQEKMNRLYRDIPAKDTLSMAKISWKKIFMDPKLQNIITKTIDNNLDLKIAIERINEANAAFKKNKLSFYPSANISASGNKGRNDQRLQGATGSYQLTFGTGWEIDIWGKLSAAKRAAYAGLLATEAAKKAVQTQIVAQASSYYYQLLSLDKKLEITRETVELRKRDLETMKALKESALVTGADLTQSIANLHATEVSIPDIENSIRQTENALSNLMGDTPMAVDRGDIDRQDIYQNLKTGLPTEILQNRPDVLQSEMLFREAFENKNFAKGDLYPSLNITGTLGIAPTDVKNLLQQTLLYSFGASVTQNIFDRGVKRAQLKVAEARKREAYYNFEKSILQAGSEVSNALFSYQTALKKETTRKLQISSLEQAVYFNQELLKYSSNTNYTDVLTSERNLLSAKLSAVDDKLQKLLAITDLYRSVGGGIY